MNREYEFSVVVFAKDTAKLYRTFKNVREVTPKGTVQTLQYAQQEIWISLMNGT